MKNIFTDHPQSVGESYLEHFIFALSTGVKLILWGLIAIIHAIFPFTFKTFVSQRIIRLHDKIKSR